VPEFAILSEIVASRVAFAARPATPAFKEEEIVILRLSAASTHKVSINSNNGG
jgi:hypothetical protein